MEHLTCVRGPPRHGQAVSIEHPAFDPHVLPERLQQVGRSRCRGCRWVARRHDRPGRCRVPGYPAHPDSLGSWPSEAVILNKTMRASSWSPPRLPARLVAVPALERSPRTGRSSSQPPHPEAFSAPASVRPGQPACRNRTLHPGPRHPADPDRTCHGWSPSRTGAARRITEPLSDYRRRSRAGIGVVRRPHGVAGGELLIPTIVNMRGEHPSQAASLTGLAPTMLVAFARYSQDKSFAVLRHNRALPARRHGPSDQWPAPPPGEPAPDVDPHRGCPVPSSSPYYSSFRLAKSGNTA